MRIDIYDIFARLVPAVLVGVPLYVLYFFLLSPYIGAFLGSLLAWKIASDVTVSIAILYLVAQINRLLSKEFYEKRIFQTGLYLPTTCYLMHSDVSLSDYMTRQVHDKIKRDFGIDIPSPQEEERDEGGSRQLIKESVSLIRMRVGKGQLVHQHNIEYGFARNFVGGSILGMGASIVAMAIFLWVYPDTIAASVSAFLLIIYAVVLLLGEKIIRSFGINYCEVLIQEYLAQ